MNKTIVFYNPLAPYYTMPLQYLALASVIDTDKYDIKIVDARLEKSVTHAHRKVLSLLSNAVCLGISVITGTPINDAVTLTRIVKSCTPGLPIVWGGWHPSIYPEQCMIEGGADYCIFGQGEITFLELLESLESRSGFDQIEGLVYFRDGQVHRNKERAFIDIANFPPYDYRLISVEAYFEKKGMRQIDFYSSQGCPYRCAFCADPYVYNRRWSGLKGSRLLFDVFDAVRLHGALDVQFLDENFFANKSRVVHFCEGKHQHRMPFSWTATSRADQIAALDGSILKLLHSANLRKVTIGAESGSQEMLELMKKDTLVEEAIVSAEHLNRYGIDATFGFIVGLPEEGFGTVLQTLQTIKEIKRINPRFDFKIFFFTPYPGTELFNYIVERGYDVPRSLTSWSAIDFTSFSGYWVSKKEREVIERFRFYANLVTDTSIKRFYLKPLHYLAAKRMWNDFYAFPLEQRMVKFMRYDVLRRLGW